VRESVARVFAAAYGIARFPASEQLFPDGLAGFRRIDLQMRARRRVGRGIGSLFFPRRDFFASRATTGGLARLLTVCI
jgi:hypothetical protein